MQCLTFRLNGVEYAVDVNIVESVVEYSGAMAVPTSIDYMKGVMELRGKVVPVINLRRKFGMPEPDGSIRASVIVFTVEAGDGKTLTIGALVDDVSEVITMDETQVEAARNEGSALWESYVRGIIRLDDRMIVILEVEGLFSVREIAALRAA
jgi:purine-binding chemotaxis protein CheW